MIGRWTIDDDGLLRCDGNRISLRPHVSIDAYLELVAAVRDADTLTQAREMATTLRRLGMPPGYRTLDALLDLLTQDQS